MSSDQLSPFASQPTTGARDITRRKLMVAAGAAAAIPAVPHQASAAALHAASTSSPAQTAPVPPGAKGPVIPASGYLVEEIADRVFWVTDGLYQSIFLITSDGVVVVDAPPTIGHIILRAISSVTTAPVTHAIYNHHHADHIGAMSLFDGARRYAQREVTKLLRQTPDRNRPLPDVSFEDRLTLRVGDDEIQLDYHGPIADGLQ